MTAKVKRCAAGARPQQECFLKKFAAVFAKGGIALAAEQTFVVAIALLMMSAGVASAGEGAARFGAYGPESSRLREQLWIMPSGSPDTVLRTTVFRPAKALESTPRPVVIINHGTSEDTRLAQSMPVFYWLSRWFVERGYVVVVPERRGHGATGGPLVESVGTCADPDHLRSGQIGADDVEAVVHFVRKQPFVDPDRILVAGISTGGWASLALASRNPDGVRGIVNFAGGRGGHAGGLANAICGYTKLVQAAGTLGQTARVPTLWLYSRNDSYFSPELAERMATAFRSAGGAAELHILEPYEDDGHRIADDQDGWDLWGRELDDFLTRHLARRGSALVSAHGRVKPATTGTLQSTSAQGTAPH